MYDVYLKTVSLHVLRFVPRLEHAVNLGCVAGRQSVSQGRESGGLPRADSAGRRAHPVLVPQLTELATHI